VTGTVMLSPQLLELLRDWQRAARPQAWLFPGQNSVNPMSARQLNRAVHAAARAAGIAKRVSPHTLRHSPGLTGQSPGGADVFRAHGAAWRKANAGHVGLGQMKVMSAIEICRTSALGDHVERCEDCALTRVAYNSCRNRHCPKCQGAAARQ